MKKILLVVAVLAALGVASVYIFIPSTITVSCVRQINAYPPAIGRFLADTDKIAASFKPLIVREGQTYSYKGFQYKITKLIYHGTEFRISNQKDSVTSTIMAIDIASDSGVLYWSAALKTSANPLTRLKKYFEAVDLKSSMTGLADQMQHYLNEQNNLYGIKVKEIELKDSVIISTKGIKNTFPEVADIYQLVEKLKAYANSKQVTAVNYPMLHVQKNDDGKFEFMLGLPVSKSTPETADIHIKYMPYRGKMFITEIKGGPGTIEHAQDQLKAFVSDSRRSVPAIPFELMVTDRSMESDTSKWVTDLYYPVM